MTARVKLYNTMSRSLEVLEPIVPGRVALYCCGPTVYNYQHIGNLRTYIFEDVLVRTLRRAGYEVTHVMNITDVGHLVSDADEGEDKMLLAARREKKSSLEIADYYTQIFFEHCSMLGITRPTIVCKATEHIQEMIAQVQQLESKGFAYVSGGNVYFDVSKDPSYGKLARLELENLQAGARIDVDSQKRNPLDFALWFTKSKFENQELQWDSPWGRGYPGWHIECSAMSTKYLGEHFDIHCGGIDHIPVHHTNEIAQAECASGRTMANIWMHGGFLVTDKQKMSKSSGEFLKLDVLVDRGIDPMSYRLFCYSAGYRNELVFSWEALEGADKTLARLKQALVSWKAACAAPAADLSDQAQQWLAQFDAAVYDDLSMPRAMAAVHGAAADASLSEAEKLALFYDFESVLGLGIENWEKEELEVPADVMELVSRREKARAQRKWQDADALRDEIQGRGFSVEDTPGGSVLKRL